MVLGNKKCWRQWTTIREKDPWAWKDQCLKRKKSKTELAKSIIYTVCPPKKWDYRNFEICNVFFSVKMLCKIKIKAMFKFSDSRALLNMALIFILHNILTEKKALQISKLW